MIRLRAHLTSSLIMIALFMSGSSILADPEYKPGVEIELDRLPTGKQMERSVSVAPGDPDIEAIFNSSVGWLSAVNFGGETFGGGVSKGVDFFNSNIVASQYVPVKIIFSNHVDTTTLCQTFRRDQGYPSSGVGTFPGAAYDISNPASPRRLNILFVEDATQAAVDLVWNPSTANLGKREYIFVMNSDYDGNGMSYVGANVLNDLNLDVLYAMWPRLTTGTSLLQSLPAELTITPFIVTAFRAVPDDSQLLLTWNYTGAATGFKLFGDVFSPPTTLLETLPAGARQSLQTGLMNGTTYFYRIEAVDALDATIGLSKEISAVPQTVGVNMTLAGVWNGRGSGGYGDIWGYTEAGTGKEYALICSRDEGVSIIDINVSPPVEVGFIPSINPGNDAKDVKIFENFAIVVKEGEPIQIVDISDVTNPVEVSQFVPDNGGAHNCLVYGTNLYVIGNHGVGGLEIVDISNPAAPVEIAQFQPFYYHDIAIRNDTLAAAGINGNGVDLLDVSNPAAPFRIGSFNYTGSGTHNVEFSADGRTLFTGDEIGAAGHWTRIWDISNLGAVTQIGEIIIDASTIVHNFYRKDNLLYIAHYTEGLRVWDISNPASSSEIASYDTYLGPSGGFAGAWSVYPYFASGKLIISDFNTGLYVVTLDGGPPSCCVGSTGNVDADLDDVVDIADLTFLIDHLFINFPPLACPEEGNVDGDPAGIVDIADLTFLIDHLFINFPPTAACQ